MESAGLMGGCGRSLTNPAQMRVADFIIQGPGGETVPKRLVVTRGEVLP
jgi:hypothetical protein